MRGRGLKLAVLGVACTAVVALGANYLWVDAGADHDWDTCLNWRMAGSGAECYPSTEDDDATIPEENDPNGWTVNLINVDRMDDLTIQGHVRFEAIQPATPVTLKANSLLIDAVDEAEDTWVEISPWATILIEDPNSP
jgi:hypothetical protein